MNALRHWKIIASLTAIFVAGAVTGSVLTYQIVRNVVRARTNPDQWSMHILQDYRTRLDLTDEQVEVIRPKMMMAGRELRLVRSDFSQQLQQILRQANAEIVKELTPEQREQFELLKKEQAQRFRGRPGQMMPAGPVRPGGFNRPSGGGKYQPNRLNGERPQHRPDFETRSPGDEKSKGVNSLLNPPQKEK